MSGSTPEAKALPGVPALSTSSPWDSVFHGASRETLEAALPDFVRPRRWFGAKTRAIRAIRLNETLPILPTAYLTLIQVTYAEGDPETYVLPVAFAAGAAGQALAVERPAAVIATLAAGPEQGILYDAVLDPRFCQALLEAIGQNRKYTGVSGDLVAAASSRLPGLLGDVSASLAPTVLGVEQSNTSVRYGDRLILKLYRRLEAGVNPDQEVGGFLTEKAAFANVPPLAGVLEFRRRVGEGGEPITVALLQGFVPNRGDSWRYSLSVLADYLAAAAAWGPPGPEAILLPQTPLLDLARGAVPTEAEERIGPYLASARLLGRRTAELHLALTRDAADPAFTLEPFTVEFQRYLNESMRALAGRIMGLLRARIEMLPAAGQDEARRVLALEGQIEARFDTLLAQPLQASRCRIHGDYHLGQVLYTGDDFMIIDFEGEPARPLGERRMKRSPLQDVAGMLRSFHYAAYAAYFTRTQDGAPGPHLERWARFWQLWVSVAFLQTYLKVAGAAAFLPAAPGELKLLLDAYLLEKAVYELGYELNNRPGWVKIPLEGILQTAEAG